MARLKEVEIPGVIDYIIPCECDDAHYLRIRWEIEEKVTGRAGLWRTMWIEDTVNNTRFTPLRKRIKYAWNLLRRGHVCTSEMILNERIMTILRDTINEVLEMQNAPVAD